MYEHLKSLVDLPYIKGKDSSYPYYKRNYDRSNDMYPFIPEVEQEWLIKEMRNQELNYMIFSHHSLANDFVKRGIANRNEIREIFRERKVLICMNGHYQTITPQDVGIGTLWNGVSIEPKVSNFSLE